MKKNWEQCQRDDLVSQWVDHHITMNPEGKIVFSRFTHQAMKESEAFLLLYDRATNTIGLNPVSLRTPDAYPAFVKGTHGGRMIRAYRLTRKFGIKLAQTVRFVDPVIDDDGVLNLDLRTARPARKQRE